MKSIYMSAIAQKALANETKTTLFVSEDFVANSQKSIQINAETRIVRD